MSWRSPEASVDGSLAQVLKTAEPVGSRCPGQLGSPSPGSTWPYDQNQPCQLFIAISEHLARDEGYSAASGVGAIDNRVEVSGRVQGVANRAAA